MQLPYLVNSCDNSLSQSARANQNRQCGTTHSPVLASTRMFIGYIDDSCTAPFQVIGGPLIKSDLYNGIELALSLQLEDLLSEDQWARFEFHASKMFSAQEEPYKTLGQEKCWELLKEVLGAVRDCDIPILYGAVDRNKVSSDPILRRALDLPTVAFNSYLVALEEWLAVRPDAEPGMLIVDNSGEKSKVRTAVTEAFRTRRKRARIGTMTDSVPSYLLDDIYFGDSKNSMGIQVADVCVYFIDRYLCNAPEAEGFYNIIKDRIFSPKMYPPSE